MPRAFPLVALLTIVTGCTPTAPLARSASDAALFAPISMRIHPIFSGVKDWTGDGKPDGLEALVEFEDQFADPTKASGSVIFELFSYRPYNPDPRGERIVNPWLGSLQTLAEQQARWNRTSRTYLFQLEYPQVSDQRSYVLTATFDTGTTRFFDKIVLEGHPRPRRSGGGPSTRPTRPSTRPAPTTAPIAAAQSTAARSTADQSTPAQSTRAQSAADLFDPVRGVHVTSRP